YEVPGTIHLSVTTAPAGPANDYFDSATPIAGFDFTGNENTSNAILTPGEGGDGCVGNVWNEVWYRYDAPANGKLTLDTTGSDYDVAMELQMKGFGLLACDRGTVADEAKLSSIVEAGQTYYILVGSEPPNSDGGNLTLHATVRYQSSLKLSAAKKRVTYGHSTTLTAALTGFDPADPPAVTITAKPYHQASEVVGSAAVGADGTLSVRVRPQRLTTYTASWAGDDEYQPAGSKAVQVKVQVVIVGKLGRAYARSGKYRL